MSGRKDYSYTLQVDRTEELRNAIRTRQAERARQSQQRLERATRDAQVRFAQIEKQQLESNLNRLNKAAELARMMVAAKRHDTVRSESHGDQRPPELMAGQDPAFDSPQSDPKGGDRPKIQEASGTNDPAILSEYQSQLRALLQWQGCLKEDQEVSLFAPEQLANWHATASDLLRDATPSSPSPDHLVKLQQAIGSAEKLQSLAGELSDRFYARNEVLTDIITSLKEIGFFVQDPEFAEPSRPEGAVIIRANRGNQTMMTSVSLDQTVESDWQGVHGEYCTDGFFEYVRAMDSRGITIASNSPELKPRLLKKGEKDLPSGRQNSAGGRHE